MSRSDINLQSRCTQLENALDFAQYQLRNLIEGQPDFFPMYTVNGKWRHERGILDKLVRGIPAGDSLDSLPTHWKSLLAKQG